MAVRRRVGTSAVRGGGLGAALGGALSGALSGGLRSTPIGGAVMGLVQGLAGGGPSNVGAAPAAGAVGSWSTGTATFYRLADGRITVQKRNGVWRTYRPRRHIVLSSNPRMGTLNRAAKRVAKLIVKAEKRKGGPTHAELEKVIRVAKKK